MMYQKIRSLKRLDRHLLFLYLLWLVAEEKTAIPRHRGYPLGVAIGASLTMFALLAILPQAPISIPAAFGGGLAMALLVFMTLVPPAAKTVAVARYAVGYYWIGQER